MSPGSTISIGVIPDADTDRAFFPLNIGVHSLIQRAVLRTSSGRVLNDTTEFPWLSAQKSMNISNEVNKNRELYTTGRSCCYEFNYDSKSATETKSYGIDNGKTYNGSTGLTSNNFSVISKSRLGLSPTYQVSLASLFPFLQAGNQLPLFMFGDDRIQIELYFTPPTTGSRVVVSKGDTAHADHSFMIDQNSLQLISDHIFYPGAMEEWASKNRDLTFGYVDYQTSRHNLTTTTATNNTRNVGGAGRLVTKAFSGVFGVTDDETSIIPADQLFSSYEARANRRNKTNEDIHGNSSTNLFYNERFLFPTSVKNSARLYHNLKDAEGKIQYSTRSLYSNEGGRTQQTAGACVVAPNVARVHFEGRTQSDNLPGTQFFQGFRLNRGERVGTKGIDLTCDYSDLRRTEDKVLDCVQISWIEVLRQARLKDGHMEVFFA